MNMQDVFNSMALLLLTEPGELVRYANEDQLGGYHWDGRLAKWPMGSLFAEEGQVLYALIRKYKPQRIVEIGTLRGCSTAHMAMALSVNGGGGQIHTVDVNSSAGDLFPKHLAEYVTQHIGDGLAWLAGQEDESIDFLFEDSSHGEDMCASIAALCKTKLKPGGILVMHDAAHDFVITGDGSKYPDPEHTGEHIRAGLTRALGNEYRTYIAEPSDCGFALWRKPLPAVIVMGQFADLDRIAPINDNEFLKSEAPPMTDSFQPLYDKHSTPVQRIDNEFKSQEHLPPEESEYKGIPVSKGWAVQPESPTVIEGKLAQDELPAVTEPPKKKRGRPSKKSKEE